MQTSDLRLLPNQALAISLCLSLFTLAITAQSVCSRAVLWQIQAECSAVGPLNLWGVFKPFAEWSSVIAVVAS